MQSENTNPAPFHQSPAKPDPQSRAPGDGERVNPVEARAASRVGLWKVLSISLVLAAVGIALIAVLSV